MSKTVGLIYNKRITRAGEFAQQLQEQLPALGAVGWSSSSDDDEVLREHIASADFVISIGGDGTMLRVARLVAPHGIPIVTINMGSLGFLSELRPEDAIRQLPALLRGEGRIDERAMLCVELSRDGDDVPTLSLSNVLNDVVVSRGATPRLLRIEMWIDGSALTTYRADGIIVATATGATAYNLAQGGPILYPQAKEMIVNPIAPHLSLPHALVLSPSSVIDLKVHTDHEAVLSADGQINLPVQDCDRVRVSVSANSARLLRIYPPSHFYATLEKRLRRSD